MAPVSAQNMKESWNIEKVLNWTVLFFREHGMATPRLDAEILLSGILGMRRLDLYLRADRPLSETERGAYRELILRRKEGEPVAYLTGEKEFWSLSLRVTPDVLIPRPETELLVETALRRIRIRRQEHSGTRLRVLDFGTGSGAVSLALASELEAMDLVALDLSGKALEVASDNARTHRNFIAFRKNRLLLVQGNAFEAFTDNGCFDFILANPPYIPSPELEGLSPEVRREPRMALDGGNEGLNFLNLLIEKAPGCLRDEGELLMEHGFDQKAALQRLLENFTDFQEPEFLDDLEGRPRLLRLVSKPAGSRLKSAVFLP